MQAGYLVVKAFKISTYVTKRLVTPGFEPIQIWSHCTLCLSFWRDSKLRHCNADDNDDLVVVVVVVVVFENAVRCLQSGV